MRTITDNIHGLILIEEKHNFISDLINSKEFQRLHRIKQLGLVHLIYPSATHSRFSHSIGVYEIARKILKQINIKVSDLEEKAILCAALLHDIGHGPMSHLFEDVSVIHHEEYSIKIILSKETEVNKILTKENPKLPKLVSDIISKKTKKSWIKNLISSDIDVDRTDYILRDSLNTGTFFGSLNLNFLISNIVVFNNKLAFREKAINSLENFLISRHHLNQVVYFNKKNLAFQAILKMFYERLIKLYSKGYSFSFEAKRIKNLLEKKEIPLNDFYILDDLYIWELIKKSTFEKDPLLKKLAIHLVEGKEAKIIDFKDQKELKKYKKEEENISWKIIGKTKTFSSWKEKPEEQALILKNDKLIKISDYSEIVASFNKQLEKIKTKKYIIKI